MRVPTRSPAACTSACSACLVKLALNGVRNADAAKVSLVMATVDPGRDTGANLRRYLRRFVKRVVGTRGGIPC